MVAAITVRPSRLPPSPGPSVLRHRIVVGDARNLWFVPDESIQLVVTSPPYFNIKHYRPGNPDQLGDLQDYEEFLEQLDAVWAECRRVLTPGGRVCCVAGSVTVARRNGGRHHVLPLPSDIQVRARRAGLDSLTPIIWLKIGNIRLEASRSARFLGKPNQPNGVVKNDIETIVMLRKSGYRKVSAEMAAGAHIPTEDYRRWFAPLWSDIPGASTRKGHPAPYPVELANRLIRMFSFPGDTVLDPFVGSGTTTRAAALAGRNSLGVDIEPSYVSLASDACRATRVG